ncbi:MAG: hypothetical protein RLZZ206_2367 [Cyanobacteriota bacterium]
METRTVVQRSGLTATRLQPADPLKQAGIHQSGHGLAIPLDHNDVQDGPVEQAARPW